MIAFGGVGAEHRRARAQRPAVELLCAVGQSRRLVHRVADDRVLIPVFGADVSGEHRPGRHADAEVDWEPA